MIQISPIEPDVSNIHLSSSTLANVFRDAELIFFHDVAEKWFADTLTLSSVVRRRMCTLHTLYQWRMKLDHLPLFVPSEGRAAESRTYPRKRNLVRLFNGARRRARQMNIFESAWRRVGLYHSVRLTAEPSLSLSWGFSGFTLQFSPASPVYS